MATIVPNKNITTVPLKPAVKIAIPDEIKNASGSLAAALSIARAKAKQIMAQAKHNPFRTWEAVESYGEIKIAPEVKALPYSYLNLGTALTIYVNNTPHRLREAEAASKALSEKMKTEGKGWGDELIPFNLPAPFIEKPRQLKAVTQAVNVLIHPPRRFNAVAIPMNTGSGKTIIAAMFIKHLQQNGYFGLASPIPINRVIYICPDPVKIKTYRTMVAAGIRGVMSEVKITTPAELRSKEWAQMFEEYTIQKNGKDVDYFRYTLAPHFPALIIVDEAHLFKKPTTKASRRLLSFIESENTRWIFMSATLMSIVNDLYMFSLASKAKWGSMTINAETWPAFSRSISRGTEPSVPNNEATKRAREFFGHAVIDPPAGRRKVKSRNDVIQIEFRDDATRQRYLETEMRWVEEMERIGKIPSEKGRAMVLTTLFRAEEERIKAPDFGDLALASHARGFAPIVAVSFMDTVKLFVEYITKRGVPRDKISIIIGGEKEIRPEDVYGAGDYMHFSNIIRNDGWEALTKQQAAKYRKTDKFFKERIRLQETPEEQAARIKWLSQMGLYKMTHETRQDEIDRFQAGQTEFCIFTLPSGGTGIDLDHQHERARPREVFTTILFYMEQFVQALGRAYRETTISDVRQHCVFYKDTIVANKIAPVLASKIHSASSFAKLDADLVTKLIEAAADGTYKERALELMGTSEPQEMEEFDEEEYLNDEDEEGEE